MGIKYPYYFNMMEHPKKQY